MTFNKMANLNNLAELAKNNNALETIKNRVNNRKWLKYSQSVALIVLDELDRQNSSQKELAIKLGTSPQYINKLLKGKEKLNIETISKLETALNINILTIAEPREPKHTSKVIKIDFERNLSRDSFITPQEAQA
jgi:transcriptional regulator with XRE-family HTH domain